jgi:hypothetical protein
MGAGWERVRTTVPSGDGPRHCWLGYAAARSGEGRTTMASTAVVIASPAPGTAVAEPVAWLVDERWLHHLAALRVRRREHHCRPP